MQTTKFRLVAALSVAAALLLVAAPGFAAEALSPSEEAALESAKRFFLEGQSFFDKGQYSKALESFLKAREVVPGPAIAYNIATCYERLGNYDQAIAAYREYLRLAGEPDDAAAVRSRIEALRKEVEGKGGTAAVTPPPKREGPFLGKPAWWAAAAVGGVVVGGILTTTLILISQRTTRTNLIINPGGG